MQTYLPGLADSAAVELPFVKPVMMTTRAAGTMRRDSDSRLEFLTRHAIDPSVVAVPGQVHSRDVAVVSKDAAGRTGLGEMLYPGVDGLLTSDERTVLSVTVADCMPIFVYDPVQGARALLHSGWRGTGILAVAIRKMESAYGCERSDLMVLLGPCISASAYDVDSERARLFRDEWGESVVQWREGKPHLDLRAANQEICRRLGVTRVNTIMECTSANRALGSYRREGAGNYTLMMAMFAGEDDWMQKHG